MTALARSHSYGIETRAVHAGASPDPTTGARNVPIFQTTSYVFRDADHAAALFNLETEGYIYTRLGNPTVAALEARVASLEGGTAAVAAASGHAAQLLAFYTLMGPGDHFVASRFLYGGSITQFSHTFPRLGWHGTFVDPRNLDEVRAAITPQNEADLHREPGQPGRRRRGSGGAGGHRARERHSARRGQHARHAVPVAAFRVGRGHRRPLHDQVPVRARDLAGRDRGGVWQVRLGARRQVPRRSPRPIRPITASTSSRLSASRPSP